MLPMHLPISAFLTFHKKENRERFILLKKLMEVACSFFDEMVNFIIKVTGYGDMTYNSRRGIFGAIPVGQKIAYHLFKMDTHLSQVDDAVSLCRKTKWHSQYRDLPGNLTCFYMVFTNQNLRIYEQKILLLDLRLTPVEMLWLLSTDMVCV